VGGVWKCVRNSSADTKVREEGRRKGGGVPGAGARDSPAARGEDHAGADTRCGGPHGRAGGYFLKETAASAEEPMEEQVLLTATVAHGGPTLDQVYPDRLQPMEWTHAGALH